MASKRKTELTEVVSVTNQIMGPGLFGQWYFVRRAKLLANGMCEVVGAKVDVTDSIEALLKADRAKRKAKKQ